MIGDRDWLGHASILAPNVTLRPVASASVRTCSRPDCADPAVVLLGFDASRRLAWFAPLDEAVGRHSGELCQRHAESMVVPKGWWLDDRARRPPALHATTDCSRNHRYGGRVSKRSARHRDRTRAAAARRGARVARDSGMGATVRSRRRPRRSPRRGHAAARPRLQRPPPTSGQPRGDVDRGGCRCRLAVVGRQGAVEDWSRVHCSTVEPLWRMSLATSAVQPVWWAAPRPLPVSPWKYS